MAEVTSRTVIVDNSKIIVHDIHDSDGYSALYQNRYTLALDRRLGLTGEPVERDSGTEYFLRTAAGSIGTSEIQLVMSYFAFLATKVGNFVGIPESELSQLIENGSLRPLNESFIDQALHFQDPTNHKLTYLKRIVVEGRNVLFPANLRRRYL